MVTFTERINKAVRESGMTIVQISQISGLKRGAIHRLLNGEQIRMYSDNLTVLCKTLGISADWLLGIKGGKKYD